MVETLTRDEVSEIPRIDLETIRCRFKELAEMQANLHDFPSDSPNSDRKKLLEDCILDFQRKMEEIELEDSNVDALGIEDLEAYIEGLKKEICSAQDENMKVSNEIDTHSKTISADSIQFRGDLEALACLLNVAESQGWQMVETGTADSTIMTMLNKNPRAVAEDYKFKILELEEQIEKSKSNLNTLQDLDRAFKRAEAIAQIDELLSGVKVIECESNGIRLLLKTPMPVIDSFHPYNTASFSEPAILNHELMIELVDKTLELKNLEIFPADVSVEEIIRITKSARHILFGPYLGWIVRQVQKRIILCAMRRSLVRDANKSRHSFEYSDRDETISAHMVGGIDAFLRVSEGWPLSSAALTLVSMKSTGAHSQSISLSFLGKVKDLANSLDIQTRRRLASFVDGIEEILVRRMRSEFCEEHQP